jgi:hypothetical protein
VSIRSSAPPKSATFIGGHRRTAAGVDHLDQLVGRAFVGTLAAGRSAEVVDDYVGPLCGQLERLAAADSVARPGHDGDFPIHDAHEIPIGKED